MDPEPGLFEHFYASPIQHPLLLWAAALLGTAVAWTRSGLKPSLRRYLLVLGGLSLADAWLTSAPIYGLGTLPSALADAVPLFFVLAGDFRYLLLVCAADARGELRPSLASFGQAAALTLIVPLASQLVTAALPPALDSPRVLFLVYELLFLLLTGSLLRWHPRLRSLPWVRSVSRFVLLYYGLWAAADTLLLATGSDLGYALRVLPNLLYYGGLIAAVALLAPAEPARERDA